MSRYRGKHRDNSTRRVLLGMLIIPGLPVAYCAMLIIMFVIL